MTTVVAISAACLMVLAIVSMVVGSYFWIRASFNRRRPSRRWFVHTNPLNAVLFEDELLSEGLKYRGKAFRAIGVALISTAALFTASAFLAPFSN
ncbi:hypothetical protein [Bradyrhizobium sp. OK095]|uniref:hypothetical protein n=1 Tax=Bradyrhizobium sp. OK095 TaxID=1882760 RepID=UPI00115FC3CE|nr:hypothetical protein [Bradyrhizobium sp. OK095]